VLSRALGWEPEVFGFRTQHPSFCEVRRDDREGRQKAGFDDDDCCFDVDQKLELGVRRQTDARPKKEEEEGRVWPQRGLREPVWCTRTWAKKS
jgi:hypothetical protein